MSILRKYGEGTVIVVPIIAAGSVNHATSATWTPVAGDVKVSKNGGAAADITTLPSYVSGIGWMFSLSSAEMQAATLNIQVTDGPTKAVEDQHILIETYGHSSALHAFDLGSPNVTVGTNNDKTGYSLSGNKTTLDALQDLSQVQAQAAAANALTNYAPAKAGDAMSLTPEEREASATVTESHLLNEGDSQMLINAIVGAIGNQNIDEVALVAALRADLERAGGNLNTLLSRLTADRATKIDNLDESISSRLSAEDYTPPDNEGISASATQAASAATQAAEAKIAASTAQEAAASASATAAAIKTKTDALPDAPASETTAAAARDASAVIQKILAADRYIDTSKIPWQYVLIEAGTGAPGVGNELLRQDLKTTAGTNVTSTDHIPGQQVRSAS